MEPDHLLQKLSQLSHQDETLQQFDKMSIDLKWNYKDVPTMESETPQLQPMDVSILPKNQGLLSTTITNEKNSIMEEIRVEIEKIPTYLTKRNTSFKEMIHQALSMLTIVTKNNHQMEELRKIAISIYQIMVIQTYHLLWTVYLKSGTGQLIMPSKTEPSYSTTVPIWPKEIKTLLKVTNENEMYLNFVHNQLHQLEQRLKQSQTELNLRAHHFQGYTLTIQKMINTYIEQHLQPFLLTIDHQIELIHYDYHIEALKFEYFRHKTNEYQEQLMKEICQSKYEQETTEQELNFLKKQIDYYNLPSQSFLCSPIAQSPFIDSIQNPAIRQQLFKQYKEVAEQARANIFTLYMTTAEEQRDEYKQKYDTNKKKMMDAYHSSIGSNEQIDSIMLGLIHQCCQKISERIQCLYKFKHQSIISNSKS